MNYRKVNNLIGWITFAIASFVYLSTMEATASFWDCGEFISCGYKMEVGHSPGAPFFMLIQRMFALLAGGNVEKVALMVNAWSALASSFTILFLFWTITHFAKRLVAQGKEEPKGNSMVLIMGAGLVGALAYTFSDTFWFSAVEGEVYATSSFFTALVFWAILKWEHVADTKHADRWLILIAYIMGLSIATHLLNLLTIPAIAMLYYYKRYTPTNRGAVAAFLIGCVILALIQFGVIQGIPYLAFKFDYLFVNSFGLPFDSGAITFLLLFIAFLVYMLILAKKKSWYLVHTGMLCLVFVFIGFSSYFIAVVRSRADVPIDMTNPDNANRFLSYVNREQFGQQPLLFGPDFNSRVNDVKVKGHYYDEIKKDGKDYYETAGNKLEYEFEKNRFFPRIWDNNDPSHVNFYRNYLGLDASESPTSGDNFKFFFKYQINWMWWRYFMWNYAGRQNDFQGQGEAKNGNWISGIKPLDKLHGVGDLDKMPDGYSNNKARNELYFLPLILGLLGLVYQFNRNKKDGIITFLLFFFTGIAIVLYLNNTPIQPRERDYAYAGSTYAFAIWIGLGVLMLYEWLSKIIKGSAGAFATILVCLLAVPTLMAKENWDDHDRSRKTIARACAWNTLSSCPENAILFTFGDNDTYPLWYLQEVEGVRKDVRIVNTSLLGIDWYIDQLQYKTNDGDAVPMIWKHPHYRADKRNVVRYYNNPQIPQNRYFNLEEICHFMISDDPDKKHPMIQDENYLPTKNFSVPSLSIEELIQRKMIKAADSLSVINDIKFSVGGEYLTKDDLAILNIVAAVAKEGWKRPVCFGVGMSDNYQGLNDYLQLEGNIFHLMPFKKANPGAKNPGDVGFIDLDRNIELIKNFKWGGAERKDVYFDEKNRQNLIIYRINIPRVADELSANGRKTEAKQLLDILIKGITKESYAYDLPMYYVAISYYRAGANTEAAKLSLDLMNNAEKDIRYVTDFDDADARNAMVNDVRNDLSVINMLARTAEQYGDTNTGQLLDKKLQELSTIAQSRISFQ